MRSDDLLYRAMMNGIREMVFIVKVETDGEFTYVFINEEAKMRSGLSEYDYGKPIKSLQDSHVTDYLYEQYRYVIMTGEEVVYKDSYQSSSGETYYSKTRLSPLLNEAGKCEYITALVQDITESTWAERSAVESKKRAVESRERFRSLFEHNLDAIMYLNLKGEIESLNKAAESLFIDENIRGKRYFDLISSTDHLKASNSFKSVVNGNAESHRLSIKTREDEKVEGLSLFVPVFVGGELTGIYWILKDITSEMKAMRNFHESEKKFRIIAENAQDLITLVDHRGLIIYTSPSYKKLLGYIETDFEGKPFSFGVEEKYLKELDEAFVRAIKEDKPFKLQVRQLKGNGTPIWTEVQGTPVFDEGDVFSYMVVISRDITLTKQYESKLKHFAYHDSLTGLPNRRMLEEEMKKELAKEDTVFSVLILDIDHFKTINDTMGHDTGDAVIEEFAIRLSGSVRRSDLVVRLGGDEFVILLYDVGDQGVLAQIAEKILLSVRRPWILQGEPFGVTTSIGMTVVNEKNNTAEEILKAADDALYKAKEQGKNTYSVTMLN
ncbi:diguanylate cyclase domain-containing protein [Jeotgalibacillus terrae]|uniref:Diguanylate cyclase domain-containing protein n=1 Tax=Jeotgalibacillus terrae TaxID=587735 RepID=A0ABW5ZGZ8_9BACL|nr:diguanylate cyclase [Jeotgalibacillus terrae]MBM7580372.1 diguanylate cyclase (GGDEF)-like protein/PAS domain S-box-containing protein [Jeotgalibacillus terrae]